VACDRPKQYLPKEVSSSTIKPLWVHWVMKYDLYTAWLIRKWGSAFISLTYEHTRTPVSKQTVPFKKVTIEAIGPFKPASLFRLVLEFSWGNSFITNLTSHIEKSVTSFIVYCKIKIKKKGRHLGVGSLPGHIDAKGEGGTSSEGNCRVQHPLVPSSIPGPQLVINRYR
jgi:hypothetical protein